MAYLKNYDNDLFISYARVDNMPPLAVEKEGWVEIFHKALSGRLAQILGSDTTTWQVRKLLENDMISDDHINITKSAIMICIVSPAYIKSVWCRLELETFYGYVAKHGGVLLKGRPRIFKIEIASISRELEPDYIKYLASYPFYESDENAKTANPLGLKGKDEEGLFLEKINNLTMDISEVLRFLSERDEDTSADVLPDAVQPLKAFLCHSSGDKEMVRSLYHHLRSDGFDPWFDEEKLLPGQIWAREIPRAVKNSDIVIVCLSKSSISKRGYVQKEIKFALDTAEEHPEDIIFLIPLRLEECVVPDRLARWQWVDIYSEKGYDRLLSALRARAVNLSIVQS